MTRLIYYFIILSFIPQTAYAGAWARKKGHLNLKVSYFSLITDERYSTGGGLESRCLVDPSPGCFLQPLNGGIKIPIFSDLEGKAKSRALFISAEYGVSERFEVAAQIGYFSSKNDFVVSIPQSISTKSNGFSDLRVSLKYQYLGNGKIVPSISAGFKAPTGEFNQNAFGVSLGEGNWDYQVCHDLGVSLWPLPIYGNIMLGYRWRQKGQSDINYGDEFIYNIEAGVNLHKQLLLKASYFGMSASSDRQSFGIGKTGTPGRKINFLAFSLFISLADIEFEIGAEHSLSGQNYISGTKLNVGVFRTFKIF